MHMKNRITLILVMSLFGLVGYGQNSIKGTVTSCEDQMPLPGVSVLIKGTTTGTITDVDGNFSIAADANDFIVFSFVGYQAQEVLVGNQTTLNIQLCEDVTGLSEVVVVGYGVKKKSLVTGAISSVEQQDMVSSVQRAEQALQGKAAGVTVLPNSGSPGSGMKIRIRGAASNGNSEPLYIVDGMKTGDINFLNPSDIESMEVLKDAASSAIYGAEGANGVVIITTKSGKKGESKIVYDVQYGIQSAPNTPELMDATQYATYMREIYDPADYPMVPDPQNIAVNTNWFDAVMDNAPMVKHNITFSGGTEASTYLISGGYSSQDGIIGGDKANFERISARVNGTHQVKDWLEVGTNLAYTNTKRSALEEDNGFNGVVNSMIMMDPTVPATYAPGNLPTFMSDLITAGNTLVRDENGNYYGLSPWLIDGEIYNPLIRIANTRGITTDNKLLGSGYLKFSPIEGLNYTSRVGMDLAFQNFNSWNPSFYANTTTQSSSANVTVDERIWSTWMWENFVSYDKSFGDHNLTLLAGMSAEEYTHRWLETEAGPMLKEQDGFNYPDHVSTEDNDDVDGSKESTTLASYFGRISYDFNNKYLFEATLRRDGSSLFGPDNKWGLFPSFSAGWNISNEDFWTIDAINYFKLRTSWGQNGSLSNLKVDNYRSLITSTGIVYPDATGTLIAGAEPDLLPNAALKWETSQQTDIGIDLRAFNDKMQFSVDYFNKVTKDLLTAGTPPLSHGNDASFANAGDVTNSGVELMLGYRDQMGDFQYNVNVNLTTLKNEVTYLNENVTRIGGADLPTLGTLTYFEQGQPVWYYRGYKTDGIDATTGEPIIVDVNGDGEISEDDMTYIGDPHPDMIYAATVNLAYKGFDFNLFMQGMAGNDNYMGFVRADRGNTNKLAYFYENRWTADNTDAELPKAGYNDAKFLKSDLMVDDGSYLKIRQIQLGYTLPAELTSKIYMSKVRGYVSLNDFFTFTKYKGMDPEVGSAENNRQGVDFGTYPMAKKVLFGLSVTF